MSSKKSKQTKLPSENKEEKFILDMKEITPKTSDQDESKFIAETMNLRDDNADNKDIKPKRNNEEKKGGGKKSAPVKEPISQPEAKADIIKHIKEVEHEIKKDIAIRKIVKPTQPEKVIRKTSDLLGQGFHYFVEIEQKITHDFLFGYLPEKIKKYIKLIIPLILMILFLKSPIDIDPQIKKALGLFIFISLLWALESISMIVTALSIPVMAIILGLGKTGNPFASFSNPIIYLLLSGLIIAQAFRKHELDKMLAIRVMALSKGRVKRLLFLLMITTALLGMWMSNTATIALLIPVILSISSDINHKIHKNYTSMLLLAAGFASSMGSITTILGSNPNAITAAFLQNIENFTFLDWSLIGFPVSVVLFILVYFTLIKIYKLKDEKIPIQTLTKEARKIRLNKSQKKLLLIFIPTILLWLFGDKIGYIFNFPQEFYSIEVIGLTALILLFAFRVLEWDDVRRIPWEIFLLVGGGLTLGQILIDTGSATFLAGKLFSLISFIPLPLVVFLLIIIVMVLANFVNNSSATIIFVPVLLEIAGLLNMNYRILAMSAAMATAIAPLTPIAMPAFSIIYGTGKVQRREMITTGFKIASICAPVLAGMVYLMNLLM